MGVLLGGTLLAGGRFAQAPATPFQPDPRMMRATRLRDVATPDVLSLMNTLGAP